LIWAETILFGGLSVFLLATKGVRKPEEFAEQPEELGRNTPLYWTLTICFSLTLLPRLTRFLFLSLKNPHGDDDAMSTWNLRARFLFTGGEDWRESLTLLLKRSNTPDYPLLLSTNIARLWSYLGDDSTFVPIALAMLFTFAIVGLIGSSIALLRTRSQGYLAALVLLGTSYLIKHGTSQYADVPLAFYILATLVLFCLYDHSKTSSSGALALAGTTAGLASWTKNEGGLFLAVIIIARLLVIVPKDGWRAYAKQMQTFALGLLPVLAILLYYKTQIAPGTTAVVSQGIASIFDKLQSLSSYVEVLKAVSEKFLRVGHPGAVLLLIYLALLGLRPARREKTGLVTLFIVLPSLLLGYCFVIITTPFNSVRYQLDTSLDRLWLHLWPSTVLLFFLIVRTPEEAIETATPHPPGGEVPRNSDHAG
jgi:hypothetical protein